MIKSAAFVLSLASSDYSQVANALLAASSQHNHVISMKHTALFPEANYNIDVDPSNENAADGHGDIFPRPYGRALLSSSFLQEIRQKAGISFVDEIETSKIVQMTRLKESSRRHTDCVMDGTNKADSTSLNNGPVGFLIRNTNKNAYFDTYDDELCIPIVEGSFVHFDGDVPHRTVIESGHVDILGPFFPADVGSAGLGVFHRAKSAQLSAMAQSSVSEVYSDETGISVPDGEVIYGDALDKDTGAKLGQFLTLEGIGLPANCTGCSIALKNASECTFDAHDRANKIALSKPLSYNTDDTGSTEGQMRQTFDSAESEPSAVFLYNHDGEPVACGVFGDLSPKQARNLHDTLDAVEDSIKEDSLASGGAGDVKSPASLRGSAN